MKIALISADESRVGMGVRTLSSCLQEAGFETVIIFMANLEPGFGSFKWDDLFRLCEGSSLIGISFMTHALPKAVEIKKRIEERFPAAPVLAGGIHATIDPESLIGEFKHICHGEGEDLVVAMARAIESGASPEDIPGLWTVKDGIVRRNAAIPLKRDINDYPLPDYELARQYALEGDRLVAVQPIPQHISIEDFVALGSRGCPHHCTYCCNKKIKEDFAWRRKVQQYSVDYLLRNLNEIKRRFPEVRSIWIEDDTFFAKNQADIEIFAKRYKEEIGLPFKILISPWTYSKEKLDPLIDAGMSSLMMGMQSGCDRVNNELYDRKMGRERLLSIANSLHSCKSLLKCYDFICMNPFETAVDLQDTINFIKDIPKPFFIFSNSLAFYPGTALHEKALRAGLETSLRVKHSEANVGYSIIVQEKLNHKLLHLTMLLMAGPATTWRYGLIPAPLLSCPALRVILLLDKLFPRLSNGAAVLIALALLRLNWKSLLKKAFKPATIARVRRFVGSASSRVTKLRACLSRGRK